MEAASGHLSGLNYSDRRVDRGGRNRHLLRSADLGVGGKAQPVDTQPYRLQEAPVQNFLHRSGQRAVRCAAETHHIAQHVRRSIAAQIRKLFGANKSHTGGHHRQEQREQLGDSPGPNSGAVQRRIAGLRGDFQWGGLLFTRIEPPKRSDHVLARTQQRGDFVDAGQQWRVDHRVGVQRQNVVDAVSRDHAQWW
ncbi:Uncharacterised protein [Mycobacterium tuberculosis]|nr:Uncharacterised protein [Mycobacterium tuberculosis]CNV08665.1 Uncharacterised protein [Mycobacterium tuberculosis]CNV65051.1 Uncharacterised protein [Mycobacterium tuberculosis]COU75810.1 Uncharacterised protein [Mycobacterium tuberculosis]COV12496.1 Uncharacterised protein [Mycobacterium tuberculosis]